MLFYRNRRNPTNELTTARTKGAKVCQSIYDMSCVGVKHVDIAKYYSIKTCTVSGILKRKRNSNKTVVKKRGKKRKLSARGLRLFQCYVFEGCYEPLFVIVGGFSEATSLQLSVQTAKRYVKALNLHNYVAIQKPSLSKKNIAARLLSVFNV